MRLDKFLANAGIGSRKEVKGYIKKGLVAVNGNVVKSDKEQVSENSDVITFMEEVITYQEFYYYMLHKPAGVISATQDNYEETVLDLFQDQDYRSDLFPVGRLDKDTEGLLVITNDGRLAHNLLSPKKHVEKEYYAEIDGIMTEKDVETFAKGVVLDGDEQALPASLTITAVNQQANNSTIQLVIEEGKFHQVKRMVASVGKKVSYLKRLRMGNLWLDDSLDLGAYRELSLEELELLKEAKVRT